MIKKLLSAFLSMMVIASLAVSASAAEIQPRYTPNVFSEWGLFVGEEVYDEGPVMNVLTWSTTQNSDGLKVTVYTCDPNRIDPAQGFAVMWHPVDGAPRLYCELGFNTRTNCGYTINYDRTTGNCTTWNDDTSNRPDSEIDIRTQNYDLHYYRIYLPQRGLYLNDTGTQNGAQLVWNTSQKTLWVNAN